MWYINRARMIWVYCLAFLYYYAIISVVCVLMFKNVGRRIPLPFCEILFLCLALQFKDWCLITQHWWGVGPSSSWDVEFSLECWGRLYQHCHSHVILVRDVCIFLIFLFLYNRWGQRPYDDALRFGKEQVAKYLEKFIDKQPAEENPEWTNSVIEARSYTDTVP